LPTLAVAVVLAAGAAHAADRTSARAFVERLYGHYPIAEHAPIFEAAGKDSASVFDGPLAALIAEDQRLTPDGDAPQLGGDPICDCQDDGGMSFQVSAVKADGPFAATATVIRIDPATTPPERYPITLDLQKTVGGWRVHDIHSAETPSLRAFLIRVDRERMPPP
jgi:hypothetical protein